MTKEEECLCELQSPDGKKLRISAKLIKENEK